MLITEVFEKLKELQDVLSEKYEIQKQIEEAPKRLTSQDELLARLKKEYIVKNASYEEVKEKVKKLKDDLASAEASRESGEKGMDNITTHREYEALDKQISEATEKEAEIRKELQKEEKYFAELDESLKSDESMIKAQEDDLNAGKDSLSKEMDKYKTQLSKLQKKEDGIVPNVNEYDPEIVYKFQRIIQRNSQGIVAVKNGVCEGCHMILPAQFANEVRKGEKILFCPYCSRILFYQESDETEENYYAMSETGSLSDLEEDDEDENEDLLTDDEEEDSNVYSEGNENDEPEEDFDEEDEDEESEEEADEQESSN